ncbi:MAG: hypothetical protein GX047_05405 [Firmicutes bacterium]|nr:hypothetical protein [Bacillota bacterium]
MIWVISLRGLGRRLRAIAKPLIIFLIIILALWLVSGRPRIDKYETEPPIVPEEFPPSSCGLPDKPQVSLAASLYSRLPALGCR